MAYQNTVYSAADGCAPWTIPCAWSPYNGQNYAKWCAVFFSSAIYSHLLAFTNPNSTPNPDLNPDLNSEPKSDHEPEQVEKSENEVSQGYQKQLPVVFRTYNVMLLRPK